MFYLGLIVGGAVVWFWKDWIIAAYAKIKAKV
ncbi:hypothetical protein M2194_004999 [Bradyrhizobium elkanii]|nr:hypothetical protein [Bradyrhizobium elkanii]